MERKTFRKLSVTDILEFMPCALSWSSPLWQDNFWVFWSRENEELFHFFQSLFPDVADTFVDNGDIKRKIIELFQCLRMDKNRKKYCMLQFWAPVKIGERVYLSTADQPFALNFFHEGLCKYREQCLNFLLPVETASSGKGAYLGPPGRMFQHGLTEYCLDVFHYSRKEFPLRDSAVEFGVREYMVLPIFDPNGHQCIGVLELAGTKQDFMNVIIQKQITEKITELKLTSPDVRRTEICSDEGHENAFHEIDKVFKVVCRLYDLPYGQIWFAGSGAADSLKKVQDMQRHFIKDSEGGFFALACEGVQLQKGHGVVGKAFSSLGACFCKNISKLSVSEYCLAPNARKLGFCSSLAIALQSTHTGDDIYVLEFFSEIKEMEDPRSTLRKIFGNMREELQSFRVAGGQGLGENLFVEVIRIPPDDELESFEISSNPVPTSSLRIAEANGSDMMEFDTYVANNAITQFRQQNEVAGSPSRREMYEEPGNVVNFAATNNKGKQIVEVAGSPSGLEPLHSVRASPSFSGSWFRRALQDFDALDGATSMARLEQNIGESNIDEDAARLGSGEATRRIEGQYEDITREVLLQHFGRKKLEDAANLLGVSRSTLKRLCRKHNIPRWRSHKARKPKTKSFPDWEENNQNGNEIIEAVHTTAQNMPIVQNNTTGIMIKASFGDDMIKFGVSVSSTKLDLESEVVKRFNLSIQKFKIKYRDEDHNWILIACDEDLQTAVSNLRSHGKTTMEMMIFECPPD